MAYMKVNLGANGKDPNWVPVNAYTAEKAETAKVAQNAEKIGGLTLEEAFYDMLNLQAIGNLEALETQDKTSIVGAINELANGGIGSGGSTAKVENATLVTKGIVKLSNDVTSTSESVAATPKAVKTAYDLAQSAMSLAAGGSGGNVNLSNYAQLLSPSFVGIPKAPTAVKGTNTEQIATTQFVANAISGLSTGGGNTSVDLSNFYTKPQVDSLIATVATGGTIDLSGFVKTTDTLTVQLQGAVSAVGSASIGSQQVNVTVGSVDASALAGVIPASVTFEGGATRLSNPQTVQLTGGATSDPAQFDGTQALDLRVTTLDATKLQGEIPEGVRFLGKANGLNTERTITVQNGMQKGSAVFDGSRDVSINLASLDAATLQGTIPANVVYNGAAAKLATARQIKLTGAVSGSALFDGSAAVTINVPSVAASTITGSFGSINATSSITSASTVQAARFYTASGNVEITANDITLASTGSGSINVNGSGNINVSKGNIYLKGSGSKVDVSSGYGAFKGAAANVIVGEYATDSGTGSTAFRGGKTYIWDSRVGISVGGGSVASSTDKNPTNTFIGSETVCVPGALYAGGTKVGTSSSDRDKKKNIVEFDGDALNAIMDTPVYTYLYKVEEDTEKEHLGVMIQDAPYEIVDPEMAIEHYAMMSYLWRGVQEAGHNAKRDRLVVEKIALKLGLQAADLTAIAEEVEAELHPVA